MSHYGGKGGSRTATLVLREVAAFLLWMTVLLLPGGVVLIGLIWLYRHLRPDMGPKPQA